MRVRLAVPVGDALWSAVEAAESAGADAETGALGAGALGGAAVCAAAAATIGAGERRAACPRISSPSPDEPLKSVDVSAASTSTDTAAAKMRSCFRRGRRAAASVSGLSD